MTDKPVVSPYGSARDLPSIQEMERQIATLKLLRILLPKEQRNQLNELESEHKRITGLVDKFYGLLGRRNWIFTGDLRLPAIEHAVDTHDAEIAEARLIHYYEEDGGIDFPLQRLRRFEPMRPRIGLLQKALADYKAGRYYSTVLVLLSVMDGFVNDLDTAIRKGLHTRAAQDMVAWDSVTGHHLGLSHAHQSFVKGFYKTNEAEVTELFRNGIVHGMLVNFDNQVVATKAWNRLFAVADWADAMQRQAKPVKPTPTLRESFRLWKDSQDQKARIEEWQPYEYELDPDAKEESEVALTCREFLENWEKRQWGPVGAHFMEFGSSPSSVGQLAVAAKELYAALELSVWKVLRVRHVAASVAHADVELVVDGNTYRTDLRWLRVDDAGRAVPEWESGRWALAPNGPTHFLKPEHIFESPTETDENR